MSTKRTVTGPRPEDAKQFHVFTDLEDDEGPRAGTVHLRVEGVDFIATPTGVLMAIPMDVWNRIVAVGPVEVLDGEPRFPRKGGG